MALIDNCDGYYKLEADGTDSSGAIGTISGTAPTFNTGKIGNGGDFASASSQFLESAAYVGGTSWTFNIWYNPTTNATNNPISRDLVSGTSRVFNLSFTANATLFGWNASGSFHQTSGAAHGMSTGTWYMWTGRWNAATNVMSLFKNGVSFQTVATTGNAEDTSVKLSIGRAGDGTGYTNGKIDEPAIWSRAATDAEITTLYAAGSPGSAEQYPFGASSSNTSAFFQFL